MSFNGLKLVEEYFKKDLPLVASVYLKLLKGFQNSICLFNNSQRDISAWLKMEQKLSVQIEHKK